MRTFLVRETHEKLTRNEDIEGLRRLFAEADDGGKLLCTQGEDGDNDDLWERGKQKVDGHVTVADVTVKMEHLQGGKSVGKIKNDGEEKEGRDGDEEMKLGGKSDKLMAEVVEDDGGIEKDGDGEVADEPGKIEAEEK